MKAKTIDRLEYTKRRCRSLQDDLHVDAEYTRGNVGLQRHDNTQTDHREGYSICPNCGQETLIHEDGCMHCRSCAWSACG